MLENGHSGVNAAKLGYGGGRRTEDDDSDVYGTEDAEFICLLEQAILALGTTGWFSWGSDRGLAPKIATYRERNEQGGHLGCIEPDRPFETSRGGCARSGGGSGGQRGAGSDGRTDGEGLDVNLSPAHGRRGVW